MIPYCGYPDDDDEDVPLVTGRRTYLALWNDVDLYGKYVEEQGVVTVFCRVYVEEHCLGETLDVDLDVKEWTVALSCLCGQLDNAWMVS